eukprot:5363953-Pyramimonas_sp.AAC.1
MDRRWSTSGCVGALNSEWISTPSTFIEETLLKRRTSDVETRRSSSGEIIPSALQRGARPHVMESNDDAFHVMPKEASGNVRS